MSNRCCIANKTSRKGNALAGFCLRAGCGDLKLAGFLEAAPGTETNQEKAPDDPSVARC